MSELRSIEFRILPEGQPARETHTIGVIVDTSRHEQPGSGDLSDVDIEATLFVNGDNQGSLTDSGPSGQQYGFDFIHRFREEGDYTIRVEAEVDFEYIGGSSSIEVEQTIVIRQSYDDRRNRIREEEEATGYADAFDDRASTLITEIQTDESIELAFNEINFSPYDNPNISVDSSARFSVHEIIGGTTVRQKIGEEPTEVNIEGVCTEDVAIQIDQLRRAFVVTLLSDRIPNGIRAQVASASTEPLEDGGAANMDRGEFLYEFNINLVEISP